MRELISSTEIKRNDEDSLSKSNLINVTSNSTRVLIGKHEYYFEPGCYKRESLIKAINAGIDLDWFRNLSEHTKASYMSAIKTFLPYVQKLKSEEFTVGILADFLNYRTNIVKVKAQSTNLNPVSNMLRKGLGNPGLTSKEATYLRDVVNNKPNSAPAKREQVALSDFFLNLSWFRTCLNDTEIYELSNQKIFLGSFVTTIATVLTKIIETKKAFIDLGLADNYIEDPSLNRKTKVKYYVHWLMKIGAQFDQTKSLDLLKLFQIDFINESKFVEISERENSLYDKQISKIGTSNSYHKTDILRFGNLRAPSALEQYLMSFLIAAQAVQPSNIEELKAGNIIEIKNVNEQVIKVQLKYFKKRAKEVKETPLLSAKESVVAKAFLAYKQYFLSASEYLFNEQASLSTVHYTPDVKVRTLVTRLLLSLTIYEEEIRSSLDKSGYSDIFPKCFRTLKEEGGISPSEWWSSVARMQGMRSYSKYQKGVKNYLPHMMFSLGAIKTSAVFSKADEYNRYSNQNFNSHSNATELSNYLTDENQDWHDRNGQVTRLVTNDMQNYAFRPTFHPKIDTVSDLLARTDIRDDCHDRNDFSNWKGYRQGSASERSHGIERIVIDSIETVVCLKHYIDESTRFEVQLRDSHAEFYRREVLPNCEWAAIVLDRKLPAKTVKQGIDLYNSIKSELPSIFAQKVKENSH